MAERRCLLILGGTGDAAMLAQACAREFPGLRIVTSLAGRTRHPTVLVGETQVGGFGGAQGLADFLSNNAVDLCIDATHPFAAQISHHATLACTKLDIARLQLVRKPWVMSADDRWIEVDDMAAAASELENQSAAFSSADHRRVFLSTGRQQLSSFAHLRNIWFLIRTVDPLDDTQLLTHCQAVVSRGPFDVDREHALLTHHRIDMVVSKNSGGDATFAKILAARRLRLPVVMLRRPAPQAGPLVYSIDESIDWLRAHF